MSEQNWEQDWLSGEYPGTLIDLAVQPVYPQVRAYSERKFRLFSCACCRRIWHLLTFANSREVVELAERYADGLETFDSLEAIVRQLDAAKSLIPDAERSTGVDWEAASAAFFAGWSDIRECHGNQQGAGYVHMGAREAVFREDGASAWSLEEKFQLQEREDRAMCDLLRDIFGNPFRPISFLLAWRTDTAILLAKQMYESREFSAMPILADALQDAGCDSNDILNHCRDPQATHVRGCWVVDLVLGKE